MKNAAQGHVTHPPRGS
jgi:hypothetical protein